MTAAPPDGGGRRRLLRSALGGASLLPLALAEARATPALSSPALTPPGGDGPFSFGFIGDTPYSRFEEVALQRVFDGQARADLAFTLHVGDIKSRNESCSDDFLAHRLALLDQSPHPLVYTPGDNEWTDCRAPLPALKGMDGKGLKGKGLDGKRQEGKSPDDFDHWSLPMGPGGRLRWLRDHAFARDLSLGRRSMAVERQGRDAAAAEGAEPRLPENQRWRVGPVLFCTLHVVGSDNGLAETVSKGRRHAFGRAAYADWTRRQQANARWLFDCVDLAQNSQAAALVLALHANLRFGRGADDGYARMRELIAQAAHRFRRPMLLLHGDTHLYRVGQPLVAQGLGHLRQIECFGSPFSASWLKIDWQPDRPAGDGGPFIVSAHTL